ncbi:unnamed protein product [Linum trigynum]|uniref:Uncharacterized protein n=1 Tax=Linum trigynum TaxID=586398 RepID=A0AAV2FQF2_9ROSI
MLRIQIQRDLQNPQASMSSPHAKPRHPDFSFSDVDLPYLCRGLFLQVESPACGYRRPAEIRVGLATAAARLMRRVGLGILAAATHELGVGMGSWGLD